MKKFLIILGCVFLLLIIAAASIWFLRRPIMGSVAEKIFETIKQDLGREITMDNPDITSNDGIVLYKLCISQKPDFSKGKFFCADKATILPNLSAADPKQISFSKIILENAEININEENGHWDFEDLASMNSGSKKDDRPFEESWMIDKLVLKNAALSIKSASNDISIKTEKSNLTINHEGNEFNAEGSTDITIDSNDIKTSMSSNIKAKTFLKDGKLYKASGNAAIEKAKIGQISIEKLALNTNLSGIDKNISGKNYIMRFSADGLLIPSTDTQVYEKVPQYLKLFAAAVGRPAPVIKDAEFHNIKGHFQVDNNAVELQHFSLRSNFMEMDGDMKINGKDKSTSASMKIAIGKNDIKLLVSGPIKKPALKPVLAETLSKKLKEAYIDMENSILEHFPVDKD